MCHGRVPSEATPSHSSLDVSGYLIGGLHSDVTWGPVGGTEVEDEVDLEVFQPLRSVSWHLSMHLGQS